MMIRRHCHRPLFVESVHDLHLRRLLREGRYISALVQRHAIFVYSATITDCAMVRRTSSEAAARDIPRERVCSFACLCDVCAETWRDASLQHLLHPSGSVVRSQHLCGLSSLPSRGGDFQQQSAVLDALCHGHGGD